MNLLMNSLEAQKLPVSLSSGVSPAHFAEPSPVGGAGDGAAGQDGGDGQQSQWNILPAEACRSPCPLPGQRRPPSPARGHSQQLGSVGGNRGRKQVK